MREIDQLRPHQIAAVQRIVESSQPILTEVTDVVLAQTRPPGVRAFLAENYQGRMKIKATTEVERLVAMAYLKGVDSVCNTAQGFQTALAEDFDRKGERAAYKNISGMMWDSDVMELRKRVEKLDLRVTEGDKG